MATVRLYNTVVDCEDALALSRFWADALGWELRQQEPGWATVGDPHGPQRLGFGPVPEGKSVKNRVHVDLLPEQGVRREDERARLEGLGARLLQTVTEGGLVAHDVMADPEGNEFCLLEPYPEYFAAEAPGQDAGPGLRSAATIFPVRYLGAALAHYAALGFEVHAYEGDAAYAFAERDGVALHLAGVDDLRPKANLSALYLYVGDADALHAEWMAAGVGGRLHEPVDTDYGLREGAHVDPDGNLLRFGTPIT